MPLSRSAPRHAAPRRTSPHAHLAAPRAPAPPRPCAFLLRSPTFQKRLIELLAHEETNVRYNAVRALGRLDRPTLAHHAALEYRPVARTSRSRRTHGACLLAEGRSRPSCRGRAVSRHTGMGCTCGVLTR